MTENLAEELETEQSMFVQTAQGIDSDGQSSRCAASRRRRSTSLTGPSGLSGTCRPPISSTCGRSATTASRPTRRTRCSRFSSPTPRCRTTSWSFSPSRNSTATTISRTRSRCSREPFPHMRDRSRSSSTRSDGRSRPSRCVECEGARGDVCQTTRVLTNHTNGQLHRRRHKRLRSAPAESNT